MSSTPWAGTATRRWASSPARTRQESRSRPRLGAVRGGAGGDGRRAVPAECRSAALAVRARRIDREVAPKSNRLAVFRGDAEHAVRRVTNVTKADAAFPKGHRVSLVLEQYRVPPGLREFTMHFEIVEGKDSA